MLRKIKNRKGQIGEILVIVVLAVLAIGGVMYFIKPMFDKSGTFADKQGSQMDSIATATNIQNGQIVKGTSISSVWATLCNQTNVATVSVTGTGALADQATAKNKVCPFTGVKASNDYKISITSYWQNGDINVVSFAEQP